ncbi:MAG: DUF4388 domain-containing protein [Myxococcota bacterium]|nr:DUF4388 domain-containing protein [Myxococcota bacterium]
MSLVGSLEDLGLVELLQIVGISRRCGVVILRKQGEIGKITLQDGQVCGALVKGSPRDLHGLLVGGGHVDKDAFEAASAEAEATDQPIEAVLAARGILGRESLGSIRRRSVEQAVLKLLRWRTGEFCLEIREQLKEQDPPVFAPEGIRIEFLALEAARLDDEAGEARVFAAAEEVAEPDEPAAAEEVTEPDEPAAAEEVTEPVAAAEVVTEPVAAAEVVAEPVPAKEVGIIEAVEAAEELTAVEATELGELEEALALPEAEDFGEPAEDTLDAATNPLIHPRSPSDLEPPLRAPQAAVEVPAPAQPSLQAAAGDSRGLPPLVLIEPDLAALEWTKASLADLFARVHIFQRCELGLTRIRQYLTSLTTPLVFLSPLYQQDGAAGVGGSRLLLRRLKSLAPRMPVLWFAEAGVAAPDPIAPADGLLTRPAARQLENPRFQEQNRVAAERLRRDLLERVSLDSRPVDHRSPLSPQQSLNFLKEATARITDAATRGEVLPVVMRFAAQIFARVAIFMVRDGHVVGLAQIGLERAGGPGDDAIRDVAFATRDSGWLYSALFEGAPVLDVPTTEGDLGFLALLGDRIPSRSYLAPVRSAGDPVALLYADNLPAERPIEDTTALEVILHQAGLALDRAALELALADARRSQPDRDEPRG